ncbi:HAD-like domain-containing protein [Cantharellus anzutake]|uniref:HAD-like domain-containing protein n=1 Tax=Cantharellus anzutake TaxID=1750568 RepID=UPI001903D623|nr:HAD-like domain-containing protein [Cantharellus anzutake]KAF8324887.1 HAD-like domain-containing protein [Cantharellus anzutake]
MMATRSMVSQLAFHSKRFPRSLTRGPAIVSHRVPHYRLLLSTSARLRSPSNNTPQNSSSSKPIKSKPPINTTGSTSHTSIPTSNPSPSSAVAPSSDTSSPPSSILPSLDFTSEEPLHPQTTGARSAGQSLSSIERKKKIYSRVGIAMIGLGLIGSYIYAGREWGEKEKIPKGAEKSGFFGRASARISRNFDYFDKPAWDELLPPPLPPPHGRPYTLILSLDDLLVASMWDRENGWRTAKRPGVEYFIGYLSQWFEVVVFTSQISFTAIPILEKLDPYNLYISYKLFRESTRSVDGRIVKDLSYLNRDLSKVIAIGTQPDHLHLHPENAIILPKWRGDHQTKGGLVGLIPFLESIAIHKTEDVRPVLKAYAGKDVAVEYAKKEAESKKKHIEEWERQGGNKSVVGGFTMSSLFGSSSGTRPTKKGPPPTYLEAKRAEAQEYYRQELAYFKAQEPQMQKMIEEERERQTKEMSGSLFDVIMGQSGPAAMLAKLEKEREEREEREREEKARKENGGK